MLVYTSFGIPAPQPGLGQASRELILVTGTLTINC